MIGWLTVAGWQASVAAAAYICGNLIQRLIEVVNPAYTSHLWHTTMLLYGTIALAIFVTTVLGPRSIIWCLVLNGVVGLSMYIAILFCASNLQDAITSPYVYPFIKVLLQALNSVAGTAVILAMIIIIDLGCVIAVVATSSRMLWSFARDRGIPGWRHISGVSVPSCSAQCLLKSSRWTGKRQSQTWRSS
jgi:hypothetical protein